MKQLKNMKVHRLYKLITVLLFLSGTSVSALRAQDSVATPTILSLSYFLPVNKVPYLEIITKKKVGRKFEPVKDIPVSVYFNEAEATNLLGKITTEANGKARMGIPPSFKIAWDSLNEFTFIAQSDLPAGQEALTADITIKKAILTIDTTSEDGVRTVTAMLKEKNGNAWMPVKDIDMKLSVKRMLGNLSVGDEETYTSDSSGISSAAFTRDSIPGDQKGNIILVAQVDDNDTYGNLATEETVGWGKAIKPARNFFDQRTLWSTRFETPLWLLFTAYSIVVIVWGTIIYLTFQVIKIKRLGKAQV